jgi:hypothetical protein
MRIGKVLSRKLLFSFVSAEIVLSAQKNLVSAGCTTNFKVLTAMIRKL